VLLTSCATGDRVRQIDISEKPNVEIIGARGTAVQIQAHGESQVVVASKSTTGTEVISSTKKGRLEELVVIRVDGDMKIYLVDEDGDGLPDLRQTRRVLKDGVETGIKTERLLWTATDKKADD